TMLFSRIVARRIRRNDGTNENWLIAEKPRNSEIDSTAIGIDAETVIPTFNTRYIEDAEKIIPRIVPIRTPENVNSGRFVSLAGTNGLKVASGDSERATDTGRAGFGGSAMNRLI